MIVFYGTKGKVIAGPQKQGVACSSCGNATQNTFGVLRYFHIFWIPLFPIKREVGTECPQCKQTIVGKEVSDTVRNSVKEAVFTTGKVLPMFTGLVILAIIFGYAGYLGTQQSKKEAAYLASPAVNDYYIVKFGEFFKYDDNKYPYGILKVTNISGGTMEVLVSNYAYESSSGARQAISKGETGKKEYYSQGTLQLNVSSLQQLKTSGAIRSVKRL